MKEKVEKDKQGRSEERKKAKEEAAKLRAAQAEQREKDQMKEEDLTPSLVQKKSLEIVSSRGRKGSDPKVLLGQLDLPPKPTPGPPSPTATVSSWLLHLAAPTAS